MPATVAVSDDPAVPRGFTLANGAVYVLLSGSALPLHEAVPGLFTPLTSLGGNGLGIELSLLIHVLGRALTFSAELCSLFIAPHQAHLTRARP